jgi:hypothetical protein
MTGIDVLGNTAYVVSQYGRTVSSVNLSTGVSTIIAGSNGLAGEPLTGAIGSNIRYTFVTQCRLSSSGSNLYILEQGFNILTVLNLNTFTNSNYSGGIYYAYDFCIDRTNTFAYFAGVGTNNIRQLNLSTSGGVDLLVASGQINIMGITTDNNSNLYFGVHTTQTICKYNIPTSTVTTIAGQSNNGGSADGPYGINKINLVYINNRTSKLIYHSNANVLYLGDGGSIKIIDLNSPSYTVTTVLSNTAYSITGLTIVNNRLYYTVNQGDTVSYMFSIPILMTPTGPTNGILYPASTNWSGNSALSILYAQTSNSWALY